MTQAAREVVNGTEFDINMFSDCSVFERMFKIENSIDSPSFESDDKSNRFPGMPLPKILIKNKGV